MNRTLNLLLITPVLSMVFASSIQAQSSSRVELPPPPQTTSTPQSTLEQRQPVTPLEVLQHESYEIRQLLLEDYRSNEVFGQMIAANSKIRGMARRISQNPDGVNLKEEGPKLELLIQDLENMIEEANFRASRSSNPQLATHLGQMIAALEDFKISRQPAAGSATKNLNPPITPDVNQEVLGPDYDPYTLPSFTEDPGSLPESLPQQTMNL